jgi:membrane associated rhomboid family serine protease
VIPIADDVPRRSAPLVTWALIALNAAVFAVELALPTRRLEALTYVWGVVPARYTDPAWATSVGLAPLAPLPFLTTMFLHGGWIHLIGNMWTLWIFGDNVEDRMGPLRFLAFYLACGVAASLAHVFASPGSTLPTIGASGAVAGVLGAYFLLFPRARVLLLVPVLFLPLFFEVPAVFFLGYWFALQFLSGSLALTHAEEVGGIAWFAHVGGFLVGMLAHRAFLRRRPARGGVREDWIRGRLGGRR